jgi:hypothetical protein
MAAAPPHGVLIFSYENGVFLDPLTRQLRAGPAPSAEVMAAHAETYRMQQRSIEARMSDPSDEMHFVTDEQRAAGVRDDVAAALAEAYAEPVPLWLCIHLWRNGIKRAAFRFDLERSGRRGVGAAKNAAALREFAADLRQLYTQPVPDARALARVMQRLRRDHAQPRLPRADAAGPLPEKYELLFLLSFADNTRSIPELQWSFELQFNTGATSQLLAFQEAHFLAPADSPPPIPPFEITICRGGNAGATAAAAASVAASAAGTLRHEMCAVPMYFTKPCKTCGGSVGTPLYFRDSPTWRTHLHMLRTYDVTPSTLGRTPQPEQLRGVSEWRCRRCDACGAKSASLKKCGACGGRGASYCSQDCQRAHWPEHREECRRHRGGAGAAPQAA